VGNHSAIGIADVICLLGAWEALYGLRRRVVGMMHVSFVRAPILGWVCRKFGARLASYETGRAELTGGHDVVTFPGGDLDAGRPFYQPRVVRFGDRRGYVKLALETGVPIVPVATIGSHWTYLIAPGGAWLARMLVLPRRLRCDCLPVPLAALVWLPAFLAWPLGWLPFWVSALLFAAMIIPNPVRITSEILEPIDVCGLTREIADPNERLEAAHQIVHGVLSRHVAAMQHDSAERAPVLDAP
jgi:1-acyl-sn-glycerol-3-phosphate acyltransferase